MLSVDEAFLKFKSRLELTQTEQDEASSRQNGLREVLRDEFHQITDFLSGSYARWTKTKPLKDIDVFYVLDPGREGKYLKDPAGLLENFRRKLAKAYGTAAVSTNRRSVKVEFIRDESQAENHVMSIDAVPAFEDGKAYKIPDPQTAGGWTKTDPTVHKDLATAANKEFSGEWKPLVKMIKKWNEVQGKPIKPSFLIEVMSLDILHPPFSGGYVQELKGFFATAKDAIFQDWPDPAGLGPHVSDQMNQATRIAAAAKFKEASWAIDQAIQLRKQGKGEAALRMWRDKIFGSMFPLS